MSCVFISCKFIFPYIAVLNTPKFNPHLKAIHNDPEYPLLLHNLNKCLEVTNYKKLDTGNGPAQDHRPFFF